MKKTKEITKKRTNRKKLESKFLTELKNSLKLKYSKSCHWIKIPDTPLQEKQEDGSYKRTMLRFGLKKPYDVSMTLNGTAWGIEGKVFDKDKHWKFEKVTEEQYENLRLNALAGGISCVIVYVHHAEEPFAAIIEVDPSIPYSTLTENVKYTIEDMEENCDKLYLNSSLGIKVKDNGRWAVSYFGRRSGIE